MERLFGDWGDELWDGEYARAVACVLAPRRRQDIPPSPTRLGEALAATRPLVLSVGRFHSSAPEKDFARTWREALLSQHMDYPRGPRLALSEQGPRPPIGAGDVGAGQINLELLAEVISHPDVGAASVYIQQRNDDAEIGVDYPWRVQVLGHRADELTEHLRDDWYNGRIYRADERVGDLDILFFDGSLSDAVNYARSARSAPRADVLVVVGDDDQSRGDMVGLSSSAMVGLNAGGVAVLSAPNTLGDRQMIIGEFLVALSHNEPVDVAINTAARTRGVPTPFLLFDPRLPKAMHVETRATAMAESLEELDPDRPLALDQGALQDLHIPEAANGSSGSEGPSAGAVLDAFNAARPDYTFVGESHEATALSGLARAVERASDEEATEKPARFLQCQLYDNMDGTLREAARVQLDTPYELHVLIGAPRAGWHIGEEALAAPVAPPDGPRGHRLTVVVWEASSDGDPHVRALWLPRSGDTQPATFAVRAHSGADQLRVRVVVLHKNRVLQTGELRAGLNESPTFELDAMPRRHLERLDLRSRFDVGLVLNGNGNSQQLTGVSGNAATKINLDQDDFDDFVKFIKLKVSDIAKKPEDYATLASPKTTELMRHLAQKGRSLQETLFTGRTLEPAILDAERVHLTCAKRTSFLPLELLYRHKAPSDAAGICPYALSANRCPGEGETPCPDDFSKVICPYGFWGMNRVIERYSYNPNKGGETKLEVSEVIATRREIRLSGGSVVGASDRANLYTQDLIAEVVKALNGQQPPARRADDWTEWTKHVGAQPAAGLLVLMPHHFEKGGFEYLEIGAKSGLKSDLVDNQHVADPKRDPGPIVMLLGCETSLSHITFDNFVSRFTLKGASIVVSTIATVLGRHVGPAAEELAEQLYAGATQNQTFGEVMLRARRATVFDVSAMGLGLTAYGDADWELAI